MGFTLGGKTDKELGLVMLGQSKRPLLPGTVDRTIQIPGKHGAWDFGADLGPRLFELECAFVTRNHITLQQKVSELAAFLVDPYGRPRTMELSFDTQPDRSYTVRYSGSLPIDRIVGLGRFTLPLIAFDPFAYAEATAYDEDMQYNTGLLYDAGMIYPNTDSFYWQYSFQMSSLYNYGPLMTPLQIEIAGAFSNLVFTNQSTQQSFTLSLENESGKTIVIDSNAMQVYQTDGNDKVNKLMHHAGDWILLQPGENQFVLEGVNPDAQVYFRWKNKFV